MRREIPYLYTTMYYFVYYINTFEADFITFQKDNALNRANDMSAPDWRSQTHVKIIVIFYVRRYRFPFIFGNTGYRGWERPQSLFLRGGNPYKALHFIE